MIKHTIFRIVVISIFFIANYYIYKRIIHLFRGMRWKLTFYRIIFPGLALSYVISRLLRGKINYYLHKILMLIGSYWIAAAFYLLIIFISADILRLLLYMSRNRILLERLNSFRTKTMMTLSSLSAVFLLLVYGYINALNTEITVLEITIPGKEGKLKTLNIAAVSDLHLGEVVSNRRLKSYIEKINSLDPDIILMAGDVTESGIESLERNRTGELFRKFKTRYGIYAVPGNHDRYIYLDEIKEYFKKYGVRFLTDEIITIGDSFNLAGRHDRSITRFGKERLPLDKLLKLADTSLPILLMDHQPLNFRENAESSIDLQISGHTHGGQIYPVKFLINMLYEKSWGYLKLGESHFYITSGIGVWGPPVRIGSISEIVNIKVKFK